MTTVKQDLWEVASVLAMVRLGLIPLRKVDGRHQSPRQDLATMDPAEARKARRKYRKLWRRELARPLREFELMPKRRQKKEYNWGGDYIRGKWKDLDGDPLGAILLPVEKAEVGCRPSAWARGHRWQLVKDCPEYERELVKAARELGLMHRRRNM